MKKPLQVALVGAGSFGDSPLARVSGLAEILGPVKAPSLRVASRIANNLRAGRAVPDYREFEGCPVVLISVPDPMAAAIISEMARAGLDWTGKVVVLCSNRLGMKELSPLCQLGAVTGSLAVVSGFESHWYLLEGERPVERQIRPMLVKPSVRVTLIASGEKGRYISGLDSVASQFVPLLVKAVDSLRLAGLGNTEAFAILEKQLLRTVRSYFRSGKL